MVVAADFFDVDLGDEKLHLVADIGGQGCGGPFGNVVLGEAQPAFEPSRFLRRKDEDLVLAHFELGLDRDAKVPGSRTRFRDRHGRRWVDAAGRSVSRRFIAGVLLPILDQARGR